MDLLIKHGTWVIVPLGLILSLVYLYVYPKVYPFVLARFLKEEYASGQAQQADRGAGESQARGATFETPAAVQSRA